MIGIVIVSVLIVIIAALIVHANNKHTVNAPISAHLE